MNPAAVDALGRPLPPDDGRHNLPGSRAPVLGWEPRQDLVLFALTAASGTIAEYGAWCVQLPPYWGHPVRPGDGNRYEATRRYAEAVALIEARTITRVLSGPDPKAPRTTRYLDTARTLAESAARYDGRRAGEPLSWGEWLLVLKYNKKLENYQAKKPRKVDVNAFAGLLDRPVDEVAAACARAAELGPGTTFERAATLLSQISPTPPGPTGDAHRTAWTFHLATRYVRAAPADVVATWDALHDHLWKEPNDAGAK